MISDAQFLEQDAKILDIFREEGLEKNLDPSQEAKTSLKDLDVEDLRRIERIVERAKFTMGYGTFVIIFLQNYWCWCFRSCHRCHRRGKKC